MEKDLNMEGKKKITDSDVLFSAISIKMNAFLMNPTARGGNLGAIFPSVETIVEEIRKKEENCASEEKIMSEDKIALTVFALLKDGFLHSNSLTVHLFFTLVDWDTISFETANTLASGIYEFATTTSLDEEKKSDNKYGKMFWYPIVELYKRYGKKQDATGEIGKLFDYLQTTKSYEGNIKFDEVLEMEKLHANDDTKELMAQNVERHMEEYKEMNKLPTFTREKIKCPQCNSEDIENAPQKKGLFKNKKPMTFKCKSCGYLW
ncbi:MAG: hypothetical protein K6E13_06845 [Lachnospiraceae bacterium]|nr:hypothetical protein [Lachnospiraceae bacterium]